MLHLLSRAVKHTLSSYILLVQERPVEIEVPSSVAFLSSPGRLSSLAMTGKCFSLSHASLVGSAARPSCSDVDSFDARPDSSEEVDGAAGWLMIVSSSFHCIHVPFSL